MVEQPPICPDLSHATLLEAFGSSMEFDMELAPLTSFKSGGPAKYFISVRSAEEVMGAVTAARRLKIPYFVMGGGSNLLVSDEGFDGLVVKIDVRGLSMISPSEIESGAGEELKKLVNYATNNSCTGLEFAAGIWGTVGGAVYGNAGAFGGEIGSLVSEVTLIDESSSIKTVAADYCKFQYRHSYLKESREPIISIRFRLQPGKSVEIQKKIDEILAMREGKHPVDGLSAGCFFKNVPDPNEKHGKLPAGRLLEQAGAKQMRVGGAEVFAKHANIIVNSGHATSKDIRQLADMMKEKVYERFGIELQEEIQQLGRF